MKPSHHCGSVAVRSQLGEFGRFLGRMAWNLAYVRINLRNLRFLQGSSSNGAQPRCDPLCRLDHRSRPRGGGTGAVKLLPLAPLKTWLHMPHGALPQAGAGAASAAGGNVVVIGRGTGRWLRERLSIYIYKSCAKVEKITIRQQNLFMAKFLSVCPDRYGRFGHQTMSISAGILLAGITNSKLVSPRYMYYCDKWNKFCDYTRSKFVVPELKEESLKIS